jgi:hypothetical protein
MLQNRHVGLPSPDAGPRPRTNSCKAVAPQVARCRHLRYNDCIRVRRRTHATGRLPCDPLWGTRWGRLGGLMKVLGINP